MSLDNIYFTRWGDTGPRVVLVHGSAQGSKVGGARHFARQAHLGVQGWQLIVPDRPGHGRSPSPGRPDDAEADAVWVAQLLGDGAHLVGHSFGGTVALAAAARRPEAVRSLTVIEPAMLPLAIKSPHVRRVILSMISMQIFSLSDASRARKISRLLGIPDEIRGESDHAELTAVGRSLRKLKVPAKADIQRELILIRDANIPLMVVTGGWSPAFEATSDAVAALGGGRRVVIQSPHHFPQNISEEFNATLVAFMREADASRAVAVV
ncbi:MAG TPA: alpha/beta hydrolase [Steroidobacteraceae bacterium]